MKKITLMIFGLLLSISAFAQLPNESFETWTAGSGPAGWSIVNVSGIAQTWTQGSGAGTQPAHTGSHSAYLNHESVSTGTAEDWLITPLVTIPTSPQLHFWTRLLANGDQGSTFRIMIGTNPADLTTFTQVTNYTETTLVADQLTYEEKVVTLPAAAVGQGRYVAFVMNNNNGDRWVIDDVSIVQTCTAPTTLAAANSTATSASLSWANPSGATSWEVEVLPSTGTPTGTGVVVTTNPYIATGLTASTTYVFYVRSLCTPAGNNSAWAGPFTFSTLQIPADLNYSTDFESANSGFTLVNGTQVNKWTVGTATSNSPTHSLYITNDAGVSNAYTNTTIATVQAYRDINIPATAGEVNLSFDWKNLGEANFDFIRVWSVPATFTPTAGTQITANANRIQIGTDFASNANWTTFTNTFNVTAYAGTTRRFVFEWHNDNSGGNNPPAAIDNINFSLVTCSQPTNLTAINAGLTSATLGWTNVGAATSWEVYVVPAGSAAPTATTTGVIASTNPYTVTGLTSSTAYTYYVRAVCSGTDVSLWSGPFNFHTNLCEATAQCNYTFNLTDSFGDGWNGGVMTVSQNGITAATLNLADGSASTVTVPLCDGLPFTLFWTTAGSFPTEMGISITNSFGQTIFTKPANTGSANTSLYTATVNCQTPACLPPTGLTASGMTTTTANLAWAGGATANYEYYVVTSGAAAPTAATVGTTVAGNAATATGLTAATAYQYYVRLLCTGTTSSTWAGPFAFNTTVCDPSLQCNYTFNLVDSFGDGWNGGAMTVAQNGITVATLTLPNGSASTVTVALCNNMPFTLFWTTAGSFPTEMGVSVSNNFGQVLFTKAPNTGTPNTLLYTGAVDCLNPACLPPSGLTATNITETTASLGWLGSGTGNWEYYVVPTGTTAPTATTPGTATTTQPVTVTGLTASTTYDYYVRIVCSPGTYSTWAGPYTFSTTQIAAVLNYSQNFETTVDWSFVNGTQPNKWVYGTATSSSPTHSLYISNDNGVSNNYTTNAASTVMVYRDIAIPAGANEVNLAFDWKAFGESCCDFLRVWWVPTSFTPTAGTQMTTGNTGGGVQVAGPTANGFQLQTNWINYSNTFNVSAFAGTTRRLVFEWHNDTSVGTVPPAAVDNVVITLITCPQPLALTAVTTSTTATLGWTNQGSATSWEIYVVPQGSPAPTAASTGTVVTTNPYTVTGLNVAAQYQYYVRAICSPTDSSLWSGPLAFTTQPLCPSPTNLAVHCLDGTSGTFDWTPGASETSWEVAVLPASSPVPTSGTVVTTPMYYATGLTAGTLYTFYVRAVCNGVAGFSTWTTTNFTPTVVSPANPTALCSGLLAVPIVSPAGGGPGSGYGSVGCLGSTPNPAWYYVTVGGTDEVVLNLTQTTPGGTLIDVDFAAFGPFNSVGDACYNVGTPPNTTFIVDCSYSASAIETINVTGQPGQVFALLITNFNGSVGNITVTQTSGTPLVCQTTVDLGPDRILCATDTYNLTATVDPGGTAIQTYTYAWFEDSNPITPPVVSSTTTSQTVTVSAQGSHVYSVVVTMPNPPANSGPITDQATIALSHAFTVPAPAAINLCSTTGTATVDLSTINFLGTLSATAYTVAIYTNQADANAGTNPVNISVPFSATTQTLYIAVTDNNLPQCKQIVQLPITVGTATATITYGTAPFCTTGGTATVVRNGNAGGVYSATPAGLTIDPATGTVTLATSTPGTYSVIYTLAATTTCPQFISQPATVVIMLAPDPATTITYGAGPFCAGTTATLQVQLTGTQGGTYSSTAGLTINPTTGEINVASSTPGTYTVTYTIAATATCPNLSKSTTVVISPSQTATIDYGTVPFCTSGAPVSVLPTGDTGGVYSATPAGLTIDPATGTITPGTSAAGTYSVIYTLAATATCPSFTTPPSTVVIVTAPDPATAITYGAGPFCAGTTATLSVQLTGTQGGTYSSTAGLTINPATGEINVASSTTGTYTVTYTIADNGPCQGFTRTATVIISPSQTATIDYGTVPFCTTAGPVAVNPTGDTGGVYSSTTGLTIDPVTGTITPGTSIGGIYTVTYTLAATASCPEFHTTAQVIIEDAPTATISYLGSSFCSNGGTVTVTQVGTLGGTFTATPAGLALDPLTGAIDPSASTAGTYDVIYTTPAGTVCLPYTTPPVSITITQIATPAVISYVNSNGDNFYCSNSGIATVTAPVGTTGGSYTATPSTGLSLNPVTGEVTLATSLPGTYDVVYTIAGTGGCPDVPSNTARIIITTLPQAGFTITPVVCTNESAVSPVPNAGAVVGVFTTDVPGLTINAATGVVTPATSTPGNYVITNTVAAANGCAAVTATQTITINPAPVANFTYSATAYCKGGSDIPAPILAGDSGTFTATPAGLVIDAATGIIDLDNSSPGPYQVTNDIAATATCGEVSYTQDVTITAVPVVAVLQGCLDGKYTLSVSLTDDPIYTSGSVTIQWFKGTTPISGATDETVVITEGGDYSVVVTPVTGAICPATGPVNVVDVICTVPKGISPGNPDGLNDTFNLAGYDVKHLSIFNRYGKEVYKFNGLYTDQWHGQTDGNDDLPTGTYFYMIQRTNGESRTGWVYINRAN